MAEVYWYISADKVRMLKGTKSRLVWKQLSLKVKLSLLEIETGVAFNDSLFRDLHSLKKKLGRDQSIVPFQKLKAGSEGTIFSFAGEAARLMDNFVFLIAMESGNAGLLMVGAPRNAVGQSLLKEGSVSPSFNPMVAVRAIAEGQGEGFPDHNWHLSFAWQLVMSDASDARSHLPRVEGLAVFAGNFEMDRSRVNLRPTIDRIVLGSPIYVRQIG